MFLFALPLLMAAVVLAFTLIFRVGLAAIGFCCILMVVMGGARVSAAETSAVRTLAWVEVLLGAAGVVFTLVYSR